MTKMIQDLVRAPEKKKRIQDECSQILEQMRHCRQCRADAIGRLGNDLKYCIKW